MRSIGLVGTVGTGKSLALETLGRLGAKTLQADREGHRILEEPEVVREVVGILGEEVIGPDGRSLDRKKIGGLVFSDADLRARYDELIRPRLLARLKRWLDEARAPDEARVIEAALIPEWGIEDWFDEVWCIECSDAAALARWRGDPGLFWRIRTAQFAPERKRQKAERVIENENSQEEFRDRIEREWRDFRGEPVR